MLIQLDNHTSVNPDDVIRVDDVNMMSGTKVYLRDGSIAKIVGTTISVTNKLNNKGNEHEHAE